MENCYRKGDSFFEEEHERYSYLQEQLNQKGYSLEQIEILKEHYRSEISKLRQKEKMVTKEEQIAKRILTQILQDETAKEIHKRQKDKNQHKKEVEQPIR